MERSNLEWPFHMTVTFPFNNSQEVPKLFCEYEKEILLPLHCLHRTVNNTIDLKNPELSLFQDLCFFIKDCHFS